MTIGIDISKHNNLKEEDFKLIKECGVDFVIIRAGYGKSKTQEDPCFKKYYKYAKSAGLKVGCYWYSYALSEKEIKKEAEVFYSVIKDFIFEMPTYLDFEEPNQFKLSKITRPVMMRNQKKKILLIQTMTMMKHHKAFSTKSTHQNNPKN